MYIRLLIALFFGGLLINADAFAKDALSSVQIVDGITQQRPPNTRQMQLAGGMCGIFAGDTTPS